MLEPFSDRAEYYRQLGWPVFPLSRDKRPLEKSEAPGTGGFHRATIDGDQIQVWSEQWPEANIGVRTGKASGVIVVDIDGPEGAQSVERLRKRWLRLPETAEVRTSRGKHLYYAYLPGVRNSASKLAPGIDIRAEGGSVVAPISIHPSGGLYEWTTEPTGHLPLFPLWIVRSLNPPMRKYKRKAPKLRDVDCEKFLNAVRIAPRGQRNHTLNRAAFILGRIVAEGGESESRAFDALVQAGCDAGLSTIESRATSRSGMRAGMAN